MKDMNFKPYLLGTATDAERTTTDRSLLTEDETFEQFSLAEEDLIEAYLQQQLSPLEQTQFEQFFLLDPERQEKLRLAQALRRYANALSQQKAQAAAATAGRWSGMFRRPVWQVALASILLVVTAVGIKTYYNSTAPSQVAHSSPSPTTTIAPVATGTDVVSKELTPGQTRAVATPPPTIELGQKIGAVEFKLVLLKDDYSNYEVTLLPDDEASQKLPGQFKSQTTEGLTYVLVSVPATALGRGDYRIKLDGVTPQETEEAARYSFTVKR